MKKATLTLGAGLILLTGWLLVPDIASAQALKTPIDARWEDCGNLGEAERNWVDEDGIRHIRGWRFFCRHAGKVRGREDGVFGGDIDPDAGTQFLRGTSSFRGRINGIDTTATGHFTQECTRPEGGVWACTEEDLWHFEDGRLLKFTVTFLAPDPFPNWYTGFLLDPPGLGPVKRNRPRSK
jgi:hypothetical protein